MGEEMNLDKMKVAELRQLAKELGLKGYSSLKKADLIDKIASHQAEEPAVEEAPAEEPAAEEAPAEEPAAEEPAPEAVVLTPEMIAIKKEKRSLKGQIADAISAGDSEKTKDLRKRKKEIRRLLKRRAG
jgi:hypothetical protein